MLTDVVLQNIKNEGGTASGEGGGAGPPQHLSAGALAPQSGSDGECCDTLGTCFFAPLERKFPCSEMSANTNTSPGSGRA